MTLTTPAARVAARRIWASAARRSRAPDEVAASANLLFTQLHFGLGRWIGGTGYRALLERALTTARPKHPVLIGITGLGGEVALLEEKVRTHGAKALSVGLVACVGVLIELLGRIIGADMAVQLVDQIREPSPRGELFPRSGGERDQD